LLGGRRRRLMTVGLYALGGLVSAMMLRRLAR
jgi:hypothetical protein